MGDDKNFDREFSGIFGGVIAISLNYAKGLEPKYLISKNGVTYVFRDKDSFIRAFKKLMEGGL
mgnify:CR=1 FL=1